MGGGNKSSFFMGQTGCILQTSEATGRDMRSGGDSGWGYLAGPQTFAVEGRGQVRAGKCCPRQLQRTEGGGRNLKGI